MDRKTENTVNEQEFLIKLREKIVINITNEQFGVPELAHEMGMSRSSLYQKVKNITNQSVSHYICETRLHLGYELLKEKKLSVSEIAYKVGFGSPTYFIKCFHDFYGFSPGEAKKRVSPTIKSQITNKINPLRFPKYQQQPLLFLFIIILLISFITINSDLFSKVEVEKSIAILPFSIDDAENNMQYLSDGITTHIYEHITGSRELRTISLSSTMKYRNSKQSLSEIAEELGVTFVLEGSIHTHDSTIKAITHLYRTTNNKPVWTGIFEKEISDIITFQNQIADKIALEIKSILSLHELKEVPLKQTTNSEAYILYLKGRYFLNRRTQNDITKSIEYFKSALQKDVNYSQAYAALASAYQSLTYWGWYPWDEGVQLSKEYTLKALQLNPQLIEAHIELASILKDFDLNYTQAEEEVKLAIELNPNHPSGHLLYSILLALHGKYEEALDEIDIAINLDPNSIIMYHFKSNRFYHLGKYNEALKSGEKALEMNENLMVQRWLNFRTYLRLKNEKRALNELKKIVRYTTPQINNSAVVLDNLYTQKGIEGIIYWTINTWIPECDKTDTIKVNRDKFIATLYTFTLEWDSVLIHLNNHWESGQFKPGWIKYGADFKPIQNSPKFIALIKKMGLEEL